MTSGTYSPAEYEFMLRKYQSDLSVAKKTISTLQSELATARLNAETVAASLGVAYKNRHVQIAVEDAKKTARSEALEEAYNACYQICSRASKNALNMIQKHPEREEIWQNRLNEANAIGAEIASLKPQPLNTNIASAPEGSGA